MAAGSGARGIGPGLALAAGPVGLAIDDAPGRARVDALPETRFKMGHGAGCVEGDQEMAIVRGIHHDLRDEVVLDHRGLGHVRRGPHLFPIHDAVGRFERAVRHRAVSAIRIEHERIRRADDECPLASTVEHIAVLAGIEVDPRRTAVRRFPDALVAASDDDRRGVLRVHDERAAVGTRRIAGQFHHGRRDVLPRAGRCEAVAVADVVRRGCGVCGTIAARIRGENGEQDG